MKKFRFLLILPVLVLLFSSCGDDERTSILFDIEYISNHEDVIVEYTSPDPHCLPLYYEIYTNVAESQVTLKCTNAADIFFKQYGSPKKEYVGKTGAWKAQIVDSNTIILTFGALNSEDYDPIEYCILDDVTVYAQKGDEQIFQSICIHRFLSDTFPPYIRDQQM